MGVLDWFGCAKEVCVCGAFFGLTFLPPGLVSRSSYCL